MNDDLSLAVFLCRALSPEPSPATRHWLEVEIDSNELPWERLVQYGNEYFITPALWSELQDKGLRHRLPEDLATYLSEMHRLNAERNSRIRQQLEQVVEALNQAGIEPLLLKGAAHLYQGAFSDPGARVMTDIDLLVPEDELFEAVSALEQRGYYADPERIEELHGHHHYAPLQCCGEPATVELHAHVLIRRCRQLLPNELAWSNSRRVPGSHLRMRLMSPTYRLLHALVHAQITDLGHLHGEIGMRALHDMAAMSKAFRAEVQWSQIQTVLDHGGQRRVLSGTCALLVSLFDVPSIPSIACGPSGSWHRWRCFRRLDSTSFRNLDDRLQNFSAYSLERRFGLPQGPFQLMRARIRYAMRLLLRASDGARDA